MERGLEALQTNEIELNTYPAIMPIIKSKPANTLALMVRSEATRVTSEEITCSIFASDFEAEFIRLMSRSNVFLLGCPQEIKGFFAIFLF